MTPVLIVAIAAIAIALTIRSARRGLAERDAVDRHQSTLDLLGSLADRADRAEPVAPPRPPPPPPGPYQPRHRAPKRRTGPVAIVAGVVVLTAAGVAGGLWMGRATGGPGSHPGAAGPTPTTTAPTRPSRSVAPTTTVAAAAVVLVASDAQQARYRVTQPSADIVLVLTSACWVEIRSGVGSGTVLFAGTLRSGTHRPLPSAAAGGALKVLLGNPAAVSVSVDGAALTVPRPSGPQPFTLVFQPA